jgi:hypothetical protein
LPVFCGVGRQWNCAAADSGRSKTLNDAGISPGHRESEDKKVAPRRGSAAFRTFLRTELIPLVNAKRDRRARHHRQSLADLFTVETFFLEPDLFDARRVRRQPLVERRRHRQAGGIKTAAMKGKKALFLASSEDRGTSTLNSQRS